MKKLILLSLTVIMTISLAACGAKSGDEPSEKVVDKKPAVELGEIKGEIKVSAFQTMTQKTFLEEAAKAFQEKYPDTKINIETFSQMPEMKTAETDEGTVVSMEGVEEMEGALKDYTQQLSVDLVSGGGADIYAMEGLPMMKYADQGLLEDLTRYMESDETFIKDNYFNNIFDAMMYKGGLYAMPTDFLFAYVSMDSTLFTEEEQADLASKEKLTLDEIIERGTAAREKENGESKSVMFRPFETFVQDILIMDDKKYLDYEANKAYYNTGDFANLLETVKGYEDKGIIQKENLEIDYSSVNVNELMSVYNQTNPFYMSNSSSDLVYEFLLYNENLEVNTKTAIEQQYGNKKRVGLLVNDEGRSIFYPVHSYGINANSANKTLAWAFVKFLTEEAMQGSLQIAGTPILKKGMEEKAKFFMSDRLFSQESASTEITLSEEQQKAYDAYVEVLNKYVPQLTLYQYMDQTIQGMIIKQIKSFQSGEQTAEETAEALQKSVELYLNE